MTAASLIRLDVRQRWQLAVLATATFTLAVDFSVLNVALPAMGRDVGFSVEDLHWIITAFALPAAGLSLFFGRLGDLTGRRRLLLVSMILLGIGSVLGGVAQTPELLITARVVQGVASAMAAPVALAMLTTAFQEGPLRSRALALNGALLSAGFTTGALVGGALTTAVSWRWAFFINIPVALFVLLAVPRFFGPDPKNKATRLDFRGAILITAALVFIVYGLTRAGTDGIVSVTALSWLISGALLAVIFAFVESRQRQPLVSIRTLRRRTVSLGNLGGLTTFAMMSSITYLMTLYLQDVLQLIAIATGAIIALIGVISVGGASAVPRLIGRFGQKNVLVASLVLQGIGALVASRSSDALWSLILVGVFLIIGSLGHIGSIIAYTVTATSGLPDDEQGLATGLTSTAQQVGIALGTPLMAAIAAASVSTNSPTVANAMLPGLTMAMSVNGAIALLVAAILGFLLPGKPADQVIPNPVPTTSLNTAQ
ncbi:MFS transporter [Microbacterium foliorum]|uniref:Antiseptic resistance protein n=1 Tax=Microbacterium foliorum TaxID=104336 RepID=A0A0F0KLV9_9MICO|nr:MFS transporter [Microbacterium foliorum]AXL13180.1 MFS transporter [Microbacterium foliorum]KJL21145.1 Antiseptic resistance protein [Microbacterium foliorum]